MAERSGRPPLFRFRFPFWTSPKPATSAPPLAEAPFRNAVAAQQPASQKQPTPASSQPLPPPATPPGNVAQQAASQSQPPPIPEAPQIPFPSSSKSAQPELVPANELSSTSLYKNATNQANENRSIQAQTVTETTSAMASTNFNTTQEAPRNNSPAKTAAPPSSAASVVPEHVGEQENEVEKREVTKEVVDHSGEHASAGEKKEQRVEHEADIEVVNMVSTPTKNTTFQPGAAADQMAETDIQEKQEVPSDDKSRPTGMMEEGSNIISGDQYSEANHTREREPSFGGKDGLQRTVNLDASNVSHQSLQHSSSETRMRQPLSLITLAGENNGATMIITSEEETKDEPVAIHGAYKLNEDHKEDMEAKNVASKKQSNKRKSEAMEMITGTFANNNSQSINNSIFCNSSCSERSPGVHIEFFKGLTAQLGDQDDHRSALVSLTGDVRIQQPTSENRIRRRCLRSLFMDSDSDTESLQKPRRHGCRYNCKAFGKAREENADTRTRDEDDVQSNVKK